MVNRDSLLVLLQRSALHGYWMIIKIDWKAKIQNAFLFKTLMFNFVVKIFHFSANFFF